MNLVLVDTSVWIDFFREEHHDNIRLRTLLVNRQVVLSPFVKLELLRGANRKEHRLLTDLLKPLPMLELNNELSLSAESLLPLLRQQGLSVGLIDYLICLQALAANVKLFTRDKVMKICAAVLKVESFEPGRTT